MLDKRFENFEKRLEYFSENDERRLEVENKLSYISKRRETYYMSEFLLHSNAYVIGKPWIYHVLQFFIIMACISTLVFRNTMAFAALIAMVVINLIVYFFNKHHLKYEL